MIARNCLWLIAPILALSLMIACGSSESDEAPGGSGGSAAGSGGGAGVAGNAGTSPVKDAATGDGTLHDGGTPSDASPPPSDGPVPGNYATSLSRTSAGVEIRFEFNCNGRACRCGRFVNGEPWVVPIDDQGTPAPHVAITRITPDGEEHGAEVNPASTSEQGILVPYDTYRAARNIMTQLPYAASPGESIFKAVTKTGCGTQAISAGCVSTDDVLTVLAEAPANDGATIFRPPFHGTWKPQFTTDNVRLDRLSSMPAVTSIFADDYPTLVASIAARWSTPHYDTTHGSGFSGEFYRGTSPSDVMSDYAAYQATQYHEDVLAVLGDQSVDAKRPAVYALIQPGIDKYAIFKMGIPFSSGAGQHFGKKPTIALFAALYDDQALLDEVRSMAGNPALDFFFQEDTQVRRSVTGVAIWGEVPSEAQYWAGYWGEWTARYRGSSGYDNNGAHGDPYGYVDGPGGGPDPTNDDGRTYQSLASKPLVMFALVQHLLPWLKYADNDDEVLEYADRVYQGYGLGGFDGFWSLPDECAGADPNEVDACTPWQDGAGCVLYRVTWGPDPAHPGQCIKHGLDPMTHGRWPELHGFQILETYIGIPMTAAWSSMRECADPQQASYPCAGLGPRPL